MPQSAELTLCDKRGAEVSLYLNLGNDCSTPVWSFHKGVTGDLTLGETEDKEERSIRDPAQLVKQYVAGKIDIEVSGEQVIDQLYEGCAFLNSARNGGEPIDIAVLSGYITDVGSAGWRGKFRNFDRTINGPESGAGSQAFSLAPAACVTTECKVRPVIINTPGTLYDYDPSEFEETE
jgi:hypothetical protein